MINKNKIKRLLEFDLNAEKGSGMNKEESHYYTRWWNGIYPADEKELKYQVAMDQEGMDYENSCLVYARYIKKEEIQK